VEDADHALAVGTELLVSGEARRVERRAGTDERPLVRLSEISDRDAANGIRGELLLVDEELGEGEFVAADLVGCRVEGAGAVLRVVRGRAHALLELEDGTLVPFVSDAVRAVDLEARTVDVDRRFLGS
jgi:16S rRNA processing protein RimM